jgi:hypothetical protein
VDWSLRVVVGGDVMETTEMADRPELGLLMVRYAIDGKH